MAEKDTEGPDESSLELPSLFGRKRKKQRTSEPSPDSAIAPAQEPDASTPTQPAPRPAVEATPEASRPEPVTVPASATAPAAAEPTRTLPSLGAPEPAPSREPEPALAASETARPESTRTGGARKARPSRKARPARERSLPTVGAAIAALLVGAVVGLLGVGLTFGSLRACDAVTGTSSCGGPGLLVVLVVVIVMIMAGTAMLRAFGVSEPGGLSFLGVAIFVAICLVFLLEHLLDPWMVVVGPALCALGYGTAHWVVNRFNTELLVDEGPEARDIR